MQDQDMQARLQAALEACARMQDQRDQLHDQLDNERTEKIMEFRQKYRMAELLREAKDSVYFRLESPDSGLSGEEAGKLIALTERIADALSGTMPEQHPDDAAVDRFATAMKAKLAAAREKGRGGWDDPEACSVEFLADLLVGHVGKGNPGNFEDIANLAMMLHQRGADPAVLAGKVPVPAVEVTETIRTAPARIWLQVGDQGHYHSEPFPSDTGEVTWCADSVVGCEVPYVRADLVGRSHVVPEGWQLVPVEITAEMWDAMDSCHQSPACWWNSALAAAPKPEWGA